MSEGMSENTQSPEERIAAALQDDSQPEQVQLETPVEAVPEAAPESNSSGGHPAYQEILSKIPASLHDVVLPTLRSWDSGVQEKLGKVQSQYAPYQGLIDSGASLEDIQAGLELSRVINTNPRGLFDQMAEHFGYSGQVTSGQGQESELDLGDLPGEIDLENHPQFKQQAATIQQMQAAFEAQKEQEAEKAAEVWLETRQHQITEVIKEKHGVEADWDFIVTKASAEAQRTNDFESALKNATTAYDQFLTKHKVPSATNSAPPVLSPNGSVPASNFDPNKMSDDQRKQLAVEMIQQAMRG